MILIFRGMLYRGSGVIPSPYSSRYLVCILLDWLYCVHTDYVPGIYDVFSGCPRSILVAASVALLSGNTRFRDCRLRHGWPLIAPDPGEW